MPFPIQDKHPFTQAGIGSLGPSLSGVYGIFGEEVCIYIGAAEDMNAKLTEHFVHASAEAERIWEHGPVYYQAGIKSSNGQARLLAELTEEYRPFVT